MGNDMHELNLTPLSNDETYLRLRRTTTDMTKVSICCNESTMNIDTPVELQCNCNTELIFEIL